jgi:hypothetical protein
MKSKFTGPVIVALMLLLTVGSYFVLRSPKPVVQTKDTWIFADCPDGWMVNYDKEKWGDNLQIVPRGLYHEFFYKNLSCRRENKSEAYWKTKWAEQPDYHQMMANTSPTPSPAQSQQTTPVTNEPPKPSPVPLPNKNPPASVLAPKK